MVASGGSECDRMGRYNEHMGIKQQAKEKTPMTDQNRGIMKFEGADNPLAVLVSSVVILGGITALILWALQSAYAFS